MHFRVGRSQGIHTKPLCFHLLGKTVCKFGFDEEFIFRLQNPTVPVRCLLQCSSRCRISKGSARAFNTGTDIELITVCLPENAAENCILCIVFCCTDKAIVSRCQNSFCALGLRQNSSLNHGGNAVFHIDDATHHHVTNDVPNMSPRIAKHGKIAEAVHFVKPCAGRKILRNNGIHLGFQCVTLTAVRHFLHLLCNGNYILKILPLQLADTCKVSHKTIEHIILVAAGNNALRCMIHLIVGE